MDLTFAKHVHVCSDPDLRTSSTGEKSGGSKGRRLRKTVSDRNAALEYADVRINPIEVMFSVHYHCLNMVEYG